MNKRLYPISQSYFKKDIEPLIRKYYKRPGRPPHIRHYDFFCSILYILRTGIPWRDLPKNYGSWHTIYTRYKRWSQKGLFWQILYHLQQKKQVLIDFAWVDSTTIGIHRHGSGCLKKRVNNPLDEAEKD